MKQQQSSFNAANLLAAVMFQFILNVVRSPLHLLFPSAQLFNSTFEGGFGEDVVMNKFVKPCPLRRLTVTSGGSWDKTWSTVWCENRVMVKTLASHRCDLRLILLMGSGCTWEGIVYANSDMWILFGYSGFVLQKCILRANIQTDDNQCCRSFY